MDLELAGKVALITGASSGIGREITRCLRPKARYITGQRIYVDGGLQYAI